MPVARIRFYAELNDFLPRQDRHRDVERPFSRGATVKDLIEGAGVPHTEVDLVVIGGEAVPFDHRVEPDDRLAVYPVFEALDIGGTTRLRPTPLRDPRFVVDVHLGRLARHLRLLGFDTWYRTDADDDELAEVSVGEHRILLTRDRGLLKRSVITHGAHVHATDPEAQLEEVVARLDLASLARPFTRCLPCNGELQPASEADVARRVPPLARERHTRFWRCGSCGRLYWRGTHVARLEGIVSRVLGSASA